MRGGQLLSGFAFEKGLSFGGQSDTILSVRREARCGGSKSFHGAGALGPAPTLSVPRGSAPGRP